MKREAERLVAYGHDIIDAESMHVKLKDSNIGVKLFLVKEEDICNIEKRIKTKKLTTIPGTMKIHQIYSNTPRKVSFRDVSCFCKAPSMCSCFSPQTYTFQQMSEEGTHKGPSDDDKTLVELDNQSVEFSGLQFIDSSHVGKHCVVTYDGCPYPGIIQDVDSAEIEVNVMNSVGENRFFWPRHNDVLWYNAEQFVTLIPPPRKLPTIMRYRRKCGKRLKTI